jgi:hypothetical protein
VGLGDGWDDSEFASSDAEHELAVLVGAEDLNLFPSILEMKLAMKAAGVLVSVHSLPLCNVATPALQWRICG